MSYNCNGIRKSITKGYLILFCMTTALFGLASCSAGKGTSTSITITDGSKQTYSVSGATEAPQSMTGQALLMEVINGITVPSEPDPVMNNSTIAGVDVNANGVRDDVERDIANKSKDINLYQSFLKLAAAHQNILVKPIPVTREEALGRAKGIVCALGAGVDISPTFTVAKVLGIDWSILTYNTPERKKKRLDVYSVLGTYDGEEVLCQ